MPRSPDQAFDSAAIVADLNERGAKIIISEDPRRTKPLLPDRELYKWRHLIQDFVCKLKEFKRIAMRAYETDRGFSDIIYLTAAVINSNESLQPFDQGRPNIFDTPTIMAAKMNIQAIGRSAL